MKRSPMKPRKAPMRRGRPKKRTSMAPSRPHVLRRLGARCFLAAFSRRGCGPSGYLFMCHVIPRTELQSKFPQGGWRVTDEAGVVRIAPAQDEPFRHIETDDAEFLTLEEIERDERNLVPGCAWHHGDFDTRAMDFPLSALPVEFWEFAAETGLTEWAKQRYKGEAK